MNRFFSRQSWIATSLGTALLLTTSIACDGSGQTTKDASPTDASASDAVSGNDGSTDDGSGLSAPNAPENLTATPISSARIVLNWEDHSDNESSFVIDMAIQDGTFEEIGHTDADTVSFAAENLSPETTYRFQVRAINAAGSSEGSNIATATTLKAEWTCPGQVTSITSPGSGEDIAPSLQDAIDNAEAGDCIELPSGEFLMGSTVTMHQAISLIGAGADAGGTTLYHPNSESNIMVHVDVDPDSDCHMLVRGIRFSGKAPSESPQDVDTAGEDYGLAFTTCAGFQVTQCRFEHFGYAGIRVKHEDCHADGIIYENSFYRNIKSGLGYGVVVYGTNDEWCASPEFGSSNFIFVEDNDFEEHRHALAGGGGGRYVVRHNTIRENLWGHAIDMHESRGGSPGHSNYLSTRAVEAYHNDLINTKFRNGDPIGNDTDIDDLNDLVGYAIGFRGGEGIVYDNNIVGYCYAILLITFTNDFSTTYPIFTQIGYDSALVYGDSHTGTDPAHAAGDFFEWNNTWVSYTSPNYPDGVFYLKNRATDFLQEDRDYHIETQKPGYTPFPYPHPDRWF